ncbi:hypothetical protein BG006_007635 [Podila minutissima]|uniref:Uncharacterized protein n=1 Tax=Podila minutissima TaxID=64525 RepID=A0A9P5SHK6_9FUNG|nr:hypothetical protein BG006_007635 [Podila minutissima]
MDPRNLNKGVPVAPPGAPTTHSTTTTTSAPAANFQVGGMGVPSAQVEHAQHQQPQHQYQNQQHPPQSQLFSQPAASSIHPHQETVPLQFQQSHQQSFFTQPDIPVTTNEGQKFQGAPSTFPVNTNITGTGDPGLHFGGMGVPGAQVELLPAKIQIQREDSMRGHPTPPPTGQYIPGQTVAYDAQISHHDGGAVNTASFTAVNTSNQTTPAKVHIASAEVIAAATAANTANAADAEARGRRRSSLAILADKFRPSSRSRSQGEERSPSLTRRLSRTLSRTADDEGPTGPYADVKQAQQEYIAKLRAEQEKHHITTNVDGLPIPPPQQRRRSSLVHVLGLDKPLLSR